MKQLHRQFCLITVAFIFVHQLIMANYLGQVAATFLTSRQQERLGYNVHAAGDMNGDGIDDFMIGTFHYNVGGWDRGAVYLFFGKPFKKVGETLFFFHFSPCQGAM